MNKADIVKTLNQVDESEALMSTWITGGPVLVTEQIPGGFRIIGSVSGLQCSLDPFRRMSYEKKCFKLTA